MKKFITLFTLAFFSFTLIALDAEARRMGGGKNIGKQRESINQKATPNQPPAPASAPAPAGGGASKWAGPLAGLAAGGLLAALFMGGAFEGINMMDILMLALLAGVIFFVIRMVRKSRGQPATRPMQFSGMNTNTENNGMTSSFTPNASPSVMDAAASNETIASTPANIPADFQVEPFLRNAKVSFIRLQAAHDAGDISDIREYTTPEMLAEISMQISERGNQTQKTEVVSIEANLLEVETTDDLAIASVRFSGQMREAPDALPEPFDEIWHVQKDLKDPESVWLLAGIQQVS